MRDCSMISKIQNLALFGILGLSTLLNGCSSAAQDAGKSTELQFTVGGTITGVTGNVVLQNNGKDNLTVSTDGNFVFASALVNNDAYNVVVLTPPEGKLCSVKNGQGIIAAVNVTAISITCYTSLSLDADAGVKSIILSWNSDAAANYNAYLSSSANCDIRAYQSCPDGAMYTNVTSPYEVKNLQNGKAYYAVVEAIENNGHRHVSPVTGAQPNRLTTNGPVLALTTTSDGTVFLGGTFSQVGVMSGAGVPLDLVRGRISKPNYPLIDGDVQTVIADGEGGWFIGRANGAIAHIYADSTRDPFWYPSRGGQPINALAYNNGRLFVASPVIRSGSNANADTASYLGAFNADGSLVAWHPAPNGAVTALLLHNNVLYVSGLFTMIAGQPRNHAAAFTMDGTLLPWDPDLSGGVSAMVTDGTSIFLGTGPGTVKGQPRQSLAAVDFNGNLRDWNPKFSGYVDALTVHRGVVYAGGNFTKAKGIPCNYLVAINSDGTLRDWCPTVNNAVSALASTPDSDSIYMGGNFGSVNGQPRNYAAAVGIDGQLRAWDARIEEYGWEASIRVVALSISGSSIYVGGTFHMVGGTPRLGLAAINPEGQLTTFDAGLSGFVYKLASDGDMVYAAGFFAQAKNQPRSYVASFNLNGTLRDWNPLLDGWVTAMTVDPRTRTVYLAGAFKAVNGIQRPALAAVGFDGSLLPWSPNITVTYPDQINAVALFNNMVYVGGQFNFGLPGGAIASNLAAFDMSGVITNWNPNPSGISSLTANNDALYVAGSFTQISGNARASLASFGKDGILTDWNPNISARVPQAGLVLAHGPTVYVAPQQNPGAAGQIAAINPNASFQNLRIDTDFEVSAITVRGSSLFIGGYFTNTYNSGWPVKYFAEFDLAGKSLP